MNRFKYNFEPPAKKIPPKGLIRSPGFKKKFEDGMPRINQKAIPSHNLYNIQITNKQLAQQFGYQFWGCIVPERRKFKVKPSKSLQKRNITTRGQNIFRTYMKRRPSLSLTPHSFDFEKQQKTIEQKKMSQTIRPTIDTQIKINTQNKTIQLKPTDSFMVTQGQIISLNNKSLYQMNSQQLEMGIQWKKKFLQILKQKMKDVRKVQFHFKPYKV